MCLGITYSSGCSRSTCLCCLPRSHPPHPLPPSIRPSNSLVSPIFSLMLLFSLPSLTLLNTDWVPPYHVPLASVLHTISASARSLNITAHPPHAHAPATDVVATRVTLRAGFGYKRREPWGVCAGIGAWNYPNQASCTSIATVVQVLSLHHAGAVDDRCSLSGSSQ